MTENIAPPLTSGVPLEIPLIIASLWEEKVHQEGTNERTKKIRYLVNLILVGLDEKQVRNRYRSLHFTSPYIISFYICPIRLYTLKQTLLKYHQSRLHVFQILLLISSLSSFLDKLRY